MKLDAYLRESGLTYRQFAKLIDQDVAQVYRWAKGHRVPSLPVAVRIRGASNGSVTLEDFLGEVAA